MGAADEILSEIPIGQLAAQLGMDEVSTERAVRQAVPALIGGMRANAEDPMGAASLQHAIGQHAGDTFAGLDLDQVDTDDGDKIVGHVFGDKREEVVTRLGADTGGGGIMSRLLPLLAPLVMSWLARKLSGGGQAGTPADADGGGLDDLIGGMTGGSGGIGDLLGGLLGGGDGDSPEAGDIGDLLGGLLGGGSKG